MRRVLISLLSDHLQPNFLLIKELEGQYDALVLITTSHMMKQDKGACLERALGLEEGSVPRIEVDAEHYSSIESQLAAYGFDPNESYSVNLTGGTKMMVLACYDFFRKFNASYYYVPFGNNLYHNLTQDSKQTLNYRLNLQEYLTLNGLRYEADNTLAYNEAHTNNVFGRFKNANFNRSNYNKLLNPQNEPTAKERSYYAGEWFEEYVYLRLKRELSLADDAICKNAKIFRKESTENDNEIDVMFVKDNQLHIVECKVSMAGSQQKGVYATIDGYLYKLAAIAKDFGLRVNYYLFTLHNIKKNPKYFNETRLLMLEKRKNILGIKEIFDCWDFTKHTLKL